MSNYNVRLPISGIVDLQVEADSEKEAIEKALERGATFDDITEWETHRIICEGNVFHGMLNEAEASED